LDNSNDYISQLKILRNTQDLIAISIRDPREFTLPNIGFVEIINPETEQKTLLNLNKKSVRGKFLENQKRQQDQIRSMFQALGIDFLDLYTNKPYIKDLLELFIKREKRH
jgi:RNA recognition motif-containing protein